MSDVDNDGFEEAYVELFVRAQRVARRIAGDAAAEDIAAETLTRTLMAWRRVQAYPQPWVTRVATNLALDTVRHRQPAVALATPEEPDEAVIRRLALVAGLRRLSRRQREVLGCATSWALKRRNSSNPGTQSTPPPATSTSPRPT